MIHEKKDNNINNKSVTDSFSERPLARGGEKKHKDSTKPGKAAPDGGKPSSNKSLAGKSGKILRRFKIFLYVILCLVAISAALGFILFRETLLRDENVQTTPKMDPALVGTPEGYEQQRNMDKMTAYGNAWAAGIKEEIWDITSYDNLALKARFFPASKSADASDNTREAKKHSYIILVHGYKDSYTKFFNYAAPLHDAGYNILMPALRAHAPSDGKYISMGVLEGEDLKDWAWEISRRDPDAKIAIIGLSMGAFATLRAGALDLPANVKCLIEDSSYFSVSEQFNFKFKAKTHLPAFITVPPFALWTRIIEGWNPYTETLADALPKIKVPLLLIQGKADRDVPYENMYRILSLYGGPEYETLLFDDTAHVKAHFTHPDEYFSKVLDFLSKHMESSR